MEYCFSINLMHSTFHMYNLLKAALNMLLDLLFLFRIIKTIERSVNRYLKLATKRKNVKAGSICSIYKQIIITIPTHSSRIIGIVAVDLKITAKSFINCCF